MGYNKLGATRCMGYFGAVDKTAQLATRQKVFEARKKTDIPRIKIMVRDDATYFRTSGGKTKANDPNYAVMDRLLTKVQNDLTETSFQPPNKSLFVVSGKNYSNFLNNVWVKMWDSLWAEKVAIDALLKTATTTPVSTVKKTWKDYAKQYALPAALVLSAGAGIWWYVSESSPAVPSPTGPTGNPIPALPRRKGTRAADRKAIRSWMSRVIRHYIYRGKPQKQAVAIAYSTAKRLLPADRLAIAGI